MAGSKIAFYEGIGDPFTPGSSSTPRKRRHSHHAIKSPAVKRQNEKMKVCAREYRAKRGKVSYRPFMASCLKKRSGQ